MDELDSVPCIEELNIAIDHLTDGKAPESENIPPDLIKTCKSALLYNHYMKFFVNAGRKKKSHRTWVIPK